MSAEIEGKPSAVRKAARYLALGLFAAGLLGCQPDVESESSSSSRWWYFEDPSDEGEPRSRLAITPEDEKALDGPPSEGIPWPTCIGQDA